MARWLTCKRLSKMSAVWKNLISIMMNNRTLKPRLPSITYTCDFDTNFVDKEALLQELRVTWKKQESIKNGKHIAKLKIIFYPSANEVVFRQSIFANLIFSITCVSFLEFYFVLHLISITSPLYSYKLPKNLFDFHIMKRHSEKTIMRRHSEKDNLIRLI